MNTPLGVSLTILAGLTLGALAVARKVHGLEKDLEQRWSTFHSEPNVTPVDLSGPALEIDYIKKEAPILFIHQT